LDQSATFRGYCNFPDVTYQWFYNGKPVQIYDNKTEYLRANPTKSTPFVTSKYDGESCYSLSVDKVQKPYEGAYELLLSNKKGEKVKTSAKLTVHRNPPVFVKELRNVFTPEDRPIQFQCQLDDPDREVTWSHKGTNGKSTDVTGPSFKTTNDAGLHKLAFVATQEMHGNVTCTMDDSDFNAWGIDKNTVTLSTTGNFRN